MNKYIKIISLILITTCLMSTIGFGIYSVSAKPKYYAQFMSLGNKYLQEGKYQEAILEFTKAIKIEGKSTDARLGAGKGYVGNNEIDKAFAVLKEAQQIDIKNEKMLKQIIEILRDVDPEAAFEILQTYINAIGENNISDDIREMLNSSKEFPVVPMFYPAPDTYIEPIVVQLVSNKTRIGHIFYYTTDGNEPKKTSPKYRGGIPIDRNCDIKAISYNPNGDVTETASAMYQFDYEIKDKLQAIVNEALNDYEKTIVGTEVGNCIEGAKEALLPVINSGKELLAKKAVTAGTAYYKFNELNDALYAFRQKIIVPTDRTNLRNEISNAKQILEGSTEGNSVGQYRSGAKSKLQNTINNVVPVFESLISRQDQIDNAKNDLTNAIERFKSARVTEMDRIFMDAGAKIGNVTVSLLWNSTDDMDLHVTSPKGDTIYYSNPRGSSSGRLDVDRQVNTFVNNPVENIYWDSPPSGTYTVKVNVYSKRSTGRIPFKVRVLRNGEAKYYDMSTTGGMITICTFQY